MQNEPTPIKTGLLTVSKIHRINWAIFGNPNGIPVISFHGGPGGRFKSKYAKLYDPDKYFVIMFDQRGCGGSLPSGEIRENTPELTVSDAAALLAHLNVKKCVVVGMSYGSTCALAFAQKYPNKTMALFIGAIFIPEKYNETWFYKSATRQLFPKQYDEMISVIKTENPKQLFDKFERAGRRRKQEIAAATDNFEGVLMKGLNAFIGITADDIDDTAINSKRIYLYYAANDFFGIGKQIMKNTGRLKNIPVRIVHGELDFDCPMSMAWELAKKIPHADFTSVPYEGHGGPMQTELLSRGLKYF